VEKPLGSFCFLLQTQSASLRGVLSHCATAFAQQAEINKTLPAFWFEYRTARSIIGKELPF
jgi:hypothetical protein